METKFKVGDRVKRIKDNIDACLNIGSSQTAAMHADKNMSWATGVVVSFYRTVEWNWFEGQDQTVLRPVIQWDNGETFTFADHLLEMID